VQPGERVTVTCVDIDDDGAGMTAAGDNPRLHVAGALPDERVTAMVEHLSPHTRAAWARLETVDAPSPARRPPACRAFGACGGCVLQHLDYDAQRTWKRARVARALAAIDVAVDACVASPRPLGYRNRSKLVVARNGGRLVLGAYAPRSHDVVDTAGCRIAEPPLDDTATALAALLDQAGVAAYDERTLVGHLRHVVLRASHDGRVLATWVTTRPLPDGPALASAFRAARPEVVGVVEHVNRGRGNAIFAAFASDGLSGCASRAARSSRPTATWPRWPTPRSRTRWRSARVSTSSTPTVASGGSPSRSRPAARRRCSESKSMRAPSPTPRPRRP
jgi:tRNA/tmRNA/rRNA uracil-C5-methylase (TrmA/RlmC/RlmD family)